MGKSGNRARDDDDDRDNDRPAKKKGKNEKGGGNTMLFALIGGGVVVLGLCCLCGGGGVGGYYMGWFGGSEKKTTVAKGGDKGAKTDTDKTDKEKTAGPPRGTGPLVTDANFDKAAKPGRTVADVEKILGPGLLLKGADEEKAKAYPVYRGIREARPGADAYQWSNDRDIYWIFFRDGVWSAHGGTLKKK